MDGFQLGNWLFHEGGGGVNVAIGRECFGLLCVLSQDEQWESADQASPWQAQGRAQGGRVGSQPGD